MLRSRPSIALLAVVLALATAGTPAGAHEGEECTQEFDSTWAAIQKVIFEGRGCTQTVCHGAAAQGGLDLQPAVAYQNLVGVFSPLGQQLRVHPGSRSDSFLWRKLAAATLDLQGVPGTPMPSGFPPISVNELEAIRLWIQFGAPETGVVADTEGLLDACLPPPTVARIPAPAPPSPGDGLQLHAPPWTIPAGGENEVCYATYYDLEAGGDGYPLSASKLVLKNHAKARRRSVKVRARWSGDGSAMGDPTLMGATLRVVGGLGEGDSGFIHLPAANWRQLSRGRGYKYVDGSRAAGGIKSVLLRTGTSGRLKINGGRDNWRFAMDEAQSAIRVRLTIGAQNWCTTFDGPLGGQGSKRIVTEAAHTPVSCAMIPDEFKVPCPDYWGGETKTCYYFNRTELTQEPNSHHSIIHLYRGEYDPTWRSDTNPGFDFACHGGPSDGQACDPRNLGACGAGGSCHGKAKTSIACITYGPPDYSRGFDISGAGSDNAPSVGGSQQPFSRNAYAPGVYGIFPAQAVVVWNSHAFNLLDVPVENQQWWNIYYAGAEDRQFPIRGVFDAADIFVQDVPPFEEREYCRTITFKKGTRLFELSSHTHLRGRLFRVWGPPIAAACRSTSADPGACTAEPGPPILVTTEYNDPEVLRFEQPLELDGTAAERRFKFCSIYDNGATDEALVKRNSTSPFPPQFGALAPGGPCYVTGLFARDFGIACLAGPNKGMPCGGDHRLCDSAPGVPDGMCDACPLRGGVTTEDEMYILLGSYYCVPGTNCENGYGL